VISNCGAIIFLVSVFYSFHFSIVPHNDDQGDNDTLLVLLLLLLIFVRLFSVMSVIPA